MLATTRSQLHDSADEASGMDSTERPEGGFAESRWGAPARMRERCRTSLLTRRPLICFDATCVLPGGKGAATYALSLLDALHRLAPPADMLVLVRHESRAMLRALHPEWLIRSVAVPSAHLWHTFTLPRLVARLRPAVLHILGEAAVSSVPVPYVMSVHEVPPVVRRAVVRPRRSVREAAACYTQNFFLPRACRRAAHLLALSESTARDLQQEYRVPPDRISVAYPAAAPRFGEAGRVDRGAPPESLPIPYVLTFATGDPREVPENVVRAFGIVCRHVSHSLVVAGRCPEPVRARLIAAAREYGCVERLHFTGYVADCDLPKIYAGADAFVEISRYEGFGLQLCEAMASGTPVIGANTSSVPEVVGAGGQLVSCDDIATLSGVLAPLLMDPAVRDLWARRARQKAAGFSWEACANVTWAGPAPLMSRCAVQSADAF